MRIYSILILLFCMLLSCSLRAQTGSEWIESLLKGKSEIVDRVIDSTEFYRVQIIYSRIDRISPDSVLFTHYKYGIGDDHYHYPAATVGLPMSLIAMEKLNELPNEKIGMQTPMVTTADRPPQTEAFSDSSNAHGFPSLGQYVRRLLLANESNAFNRLYEFVGQEELNTILWRKGFSNIKIVHRLDAPEYSIEDNCWSNPVYFLAKDTFTINKASNYACIRQDLFLQYNPQLDLQQGRAYLDEEHQLVQSPFDFTFKNLMSLDALHRMMRCLFFPMSFENQMRFQLNEDQVNWIYKALGQELTESGSPRYAQLEDHFKYLIPTKNNSPDPMGYRVFNQSGKAYGYMTDSAYFIHPKTGAEFFLSANVYVNKNDIFNDDHYEYEDVGLPFLSDLGLIFMEYENKRARRSRPDHSSLEALFID